MFSAGKAPAIFAGNNRYRPLPYWTAAKQDTHRCGCDLDNDADTSARAPASRELDDGRWPRSRTVDIPDR